MPESDKPVVKLPGIDDPFRSIVESARDYAIFLLDREGHILSWNRGAQSIKGYEPREIIGRHFSAFYTREANDRRWPQQELEIAARDGRLEDEGWRVRKDGSLFWANVIITALRDPAGELRGFSKITRDLTERRRQERMLRESEERFRLMIESVKDYAIFMLDTQGRVASWNAGAERIKGYRADEIIGEHFRLFYTDEARHRRWPEEELRRARDDGRYEEEGTRVRRDGTTFWANVVITPVRDSTGELRGYAKVTRDLSDRKRIESLETQDRQMQEFLAVLAHELRNPLAPISNALSLLARKPTADPAEIWVRDVLQRQTTQLARLVDDLLDVSRITRAALVLDRKPIDLRTVVRHAADASMQWYEQRRHTLDVNVSDERVVVDGDEVRLSQVVQNLLHNAAKYTPEGGRIDVRVRRDGAHAVIVVRDNGIGMAPETLNTAFELFKQAHQGLDRTQGGLGVGLTLVQRLVRMHGGSVEARSEGPGRGSEFIVRLALREEPAIVRQAGEGRPGMPAAKPARRRILVVDDNRDAAQALRLLLESDGHEVRVASDGPGGLSLAQQYPPDVALLDIGLPQMDGYELARRMRQDPALAGALLVAVTGYGQMHDRARASASGFNHHLVKPVEFSALQRLLQETV
ncbi:MAG TPA: PAS domain S-box protein [Burkholderiales bacterium]|nr:PAS domain S-box protein [Burkholderiales bacterium]